MPINPLAYVRIPYLRAYADCMTKGSFTAAFARTLSFVPALNAEKATSVVPDTIRPVLIVHLGRIIATIILLASDIPLLCPLSGIIFRRIFGIIFDHFGPLLKQPPQLF